TFPALFGLYRQNFLPNDVHILGYARTKMDEAEFHKRQTQYIKNESDDQDLNAKIEQFKSLSTYVAGDYDGDNGYQELNKKIEEIESKYQSQERNRLFYMALPPSVFQKVAIGLKKNCYTDKGTIRVIVEKPFGKDLQSSRELLGGLKQNFTEEETFRIDHYLGKEMVKNMMVSRFANIALSAGWDKNSISNVQITFKEPFGTEGRGGYFDEFGIIRDVLQNRQFIVFALLITKRTQPLSRLDSSIEYPDYGAASVIRRGGHPQRKGQSIEGNTPGFERGCLARPIRIGQRQARIPR
ncbi:Glucose-6-phosphate 1-dehydrogenase, partial [Serendipita sp. 407]